MDAYERSLKQQAERIKRELSKEGQTLSSPPKVEVTDELIPSDVPSPIYGYARPKPKIMLPVEHSPETREVLDSSVNIDSLPTESEETEDESAKSESTEGREAISGEVKMEEKSILGEVSITNNGFSSVFMQSTDLSRSNKESIVEMHHDATPSDALNIEEAKEKIGSSIEQIAERLQTTSEQQELPSDTELTPAVEVSFKADQPPVNVMMTPKDRMAMYRSRRLAQKNNNL
ncbi:hypothetical protein [Exiguobacterium qingdaonense]|uniref:hypothetical protein n=1 Tax=Exiguobacterium qingdaonense TaxID=2751251 RepID=UPI001BE57321|nr:hypothetical protein [Exiguobacterium qingdaonense]